LNGHHQMLFSTGCRKSRIFLNLLEGEQTDNPLANGKETAVVKKKKRKERTLRRQELRNA